jgi:hypothetical protein
MYKKFLFLIPLLLLPNFGQAATCAIQPSPTVVNNWADIGSLVSGYPATRFTVASGCTVSTVGVHVFKNGTPVDNLGVYIYNEAGGYPNALLDTGSLISPASLTTNPGGVATTTGWTTTLSTGTNYWLVLNRTGSINAVNRYGWAAFAGTGATSAVNTGSWAADTNSFVYEIDGTAVVAPTSTTATATTTLISDPNRDFFNGQLLFLIGFFGIIWLFKKR